MSANRKKKYNPERGEYRRRSMLYRFRDAKLSSLVKGVTVAHNGTWVTKDAHDPLQDKMEYQITGLEPLRDHLHKEPEWRPMSTAPRECKCIKVKHAKTGEEYFAKFFYEGWSCSLSRYKPDNTFLFFDSQLSGWRHL